MRYLFIFLMFTSSLVLSDRQTIRTQVEHLFKTHQYEKAEKILQAHKDHTDALYYLGVVEMIKGNLDAAIDAAQQGLQRGDDKARFYELLGDIYAVKAQNAGMLSLMFTVGKIKKNWQKAIEIDSTRISAYRKLFSFYLMAPGFAGGDKEQALAIAQRVTRLNPALGQTMLAQYYQQMEQNDRAEQAFNQALTLAPDSASIIQEAAYFYLRTKHYARSRHLFEKALRLRPKTPQAYAAFADWYYKTGKKDSAVVLLDKALALDSLNQEIRFKKARFLADLGRYDEARTICNRLLDQELFFALRKQIAGFLQLIKNK